MSARPSDPVAPVRCPPHPSSLRHWQRVLSVDLLRTPMSGQERRWYVAERERAAKCMRAHGLAIPAGSKPWTPDERAAFALAREALAAGVEGRTVAK